MNKFMLNGVIEKIDYEAYVNPASGKCKAIIKVADDGSEFDIETWDIDQLKELDLKPGESISIRGNISSREYNDRKYYSLLLKKVKRIENELF